MKLRTLCTSKPVDLPLADFLAFFHIVEDFSLTLLYISSCLHRHSLLPRLFRSVHSISIRWRSGRWSLSTTETLVQIWCRVWHVFVAWPSFSCRTDGLAMAWAVRIWFGDCEAPRPCCGPLIIIHNGQTFPLRSNLYKGNYSRNLEVHQLKSRSHILSFTHIYTIVRPILNLCCHEFYSLT